MAEPLQPLGVAAGWRVTWNTLFDVEPTEDNVLRGFFGGSSLFMAVHEHWRLCVVVQWRPEDDPAGEYQLQVAYAP
jgi:hypothetical protein